MRLLQDQRQDEPAKPGLTDAIGADPTARACYRAVRYLPILLRDRLHQEGIWEDLRQELRLAAGELGEIEVVIEPASGAAAGDYIIGVRAASDRASATLDIRVTVGRSSSWGWIGLGTVLAVIVGMVGVFWRARRR